MKTAESPQSIGKERSGPRKVSGGEAPSTKAENSNGKLPLTQDQRNELFTRLERVIEKLPRSAEGKRPESPLKALDFAIDAHREQWRSSGEPYIYHCVAVAELVADLIPEETTISAALLHDVVEDTSIPAREVKDFFGEDVAFLVEGVTKVSQIRFALSHEKQIENLRRLLVATAKDLRVILIKLCDRLHNMRTLGALSPAKQRRICRSTLDVYAPLAHRLGLQRLKNELQDHCLAYLNPTVYRHIREKVAERLAERQEYAKKVQNIIADVLATHGIDASVEWRVKHFWSIYRKMERDNKDFSEIYDLTGIRILVDSVDQCYAALGIVHSVWPPVEGRFKDYISRPKPNDYRSIHTTLLGPEGRLLELQIRTKQMHRVCEDGVAAHWRYKERGRSSRRLGDDAAWISQLSGLLQEGGHPDDWRLSLRTELFSDETYCYTPKGDIIRLPTGSSPIDFAYQIHTDLGDHCKGARVNGSYVPLSHKLKTGDVVEIETSKNAHPTTDWLNLVKTGRARHKIRNYLIEANRETLVEEGNLLLSRELHRIGQDPETFYRSDLSASILKKLKVGNLDDLFALVGFGRIATKQVVARIIQSKSTDKKGKSVVRGEAIRISDIDDMLYRLARCCHPVPGEQIVGLVTRNRGISIHRQDCVNIRRFEGDRQRLLPLYWSLSGKDRNALEIAIQALDRHQLLADVTNLISSSGIDIRGCRSETNRDGRHATLRFTIEIRDIKQLRRLARHLIQLEGVLTVSQMRGPRKVRLA